MVPLIIFDHVLTLGAAPQQIGQHLCLLRLVVGGASVVANAARAAGDHIGGIERPSTRLVGRPAITGITAGVPGFVEAVAVNDKVGHMINATASLERWPDGDNPAPAAGPTIETS